MFTKLLSYVCVCVRTRSDWKKTLPLWVHCQQNTSQPQCPGCLLTLPSNTCLNPHRSLLGFPHTLAFLSDLERSLNRSEPEDVAEILRNACQCPSKLSLSDTSEFPLLSERKASLLTPPWGVPKGSSGCGWASPGSVPEHTCQVGDLPQGLAAPQWGLLLDSKCDRLPEVSIPGWSPGSEKVLL